MTGKEALKHIIEDNFNMIITTYPPKPAYNGLTKEDMIAIIERDLEVLNIFIELFDTEIIKLKKWCILDDVYQFMLQFKEEKFNITERQYKVIKEWLENDK